MLSAARILMCSHQLFPSNDGLSCCASEGSRKTAINMDKRDFLIIVPPKNLPHDSEPQRLKPEPLSHYARLNRVRNSSYAVILSGVFASLCEAARSRRIPSCVTQ